MQPTQHSTFQRLRRAACALLAPALLTAHAAADVWVVDAEGAGDFEEIQPAIDAAQDGDTILVRSPVGGERRYPGFRIEAKGLAILGPEQGTLPTGAVQVRGLAPDQVVVLSRLDMRWNAFELWGLPREPGAEPGLELLHNAGRVRLQDCRISGNVVAAPDQLRDSAALVVEASADVVLRQCQLIGGVGLAPPQGPTPGAAALETSGSLVVLQECELEGGRGGTLTLPGGDRFGAAGGAGLSVASGVVHATGGRILGGTGGHASAGSGSSVGGRGGHAVVVSTAAVAYAVGVAIEGGPGGEGATRSGRPGRDVLGSLTRFDGAGRGVQMARFGRALEASRIVVRGHPGERALLLVSRDTHARFFGPEAGFQVTREPLPGGRMDLGVLPASGELALDFVLPDAAPDGIEPLYFQATFLDPGGQLHFGDTKVLGVIGAQALPPCGARIHVDADAPLGGDGSSWGAAFRDLRQALLSAPDCFDAPTEVWVAEGTYLPALQNSARSFVLRPGTWLVGGFAGDELERRERDPVARPVVLSGDLLGDDGPDFGGRSDNARVVVRSGSRTSPVDGTRIDGVTVRGGEGGFDGDGAGVYVAGGATLSRCTIEDNRGDFGGGVFCAGRLLNLVACTLRGNAASGGAGITFSGRDVESHLLRIENCLVHANSASAAGGILAGGGRVEITNSTVHGNRAFLGFAGASVGPAATLANTILWGNGSGHFDDQLFASAPPAIDYCCIQDLDPAFPGLGNQSLDPRFVDELGADGVAQTADDDLRLGPGSPCDDAGANARVPPDRADLDSDENRLEPLPLDLLGHRRFSDDPGAADVGAGSAPLTDLGPLERRP